MKYYMICNGGLVWHYSHWNGQRHEVVKQLGICLHLSGPLFQSIYMSVSLNLSENLHCQTGCSCIMKALGLANCARSALAWMIQQPHISVFIHQINNAFIRYQIRMSCLNLRIMGWFHYAISSAHLLFYNLSSFI